MIDLTKPVRHNDAGFFAAADTLTDRQLRLYVELRNSFRQFQRDAEFRQMFEGALRSPKPLTDDERADTQALAADKYRRSQTQGASFRSPLPSATGAELFEVEGCCRQSRL